MLAGLVGFGLGEARAADLEAKWYAEGNEIKAWYKSLVKAPKGWVANEEWTDRYERVFLFENGDMSRKKPVMYVRAHPGEDGAIEQYIEVAQKRWLEKMKDCTIKPEPDLERPGKPPIKIYLYNNPSATDQSFELTAFVKDKSPQYPDGTFYFQIVLSAPSMKELERTRAAFMEVLGNL